MGILLTLKIPCTLPMLSTYQEKYGEIHQARQGDAAKNPRRAASGWIEFEHIQIG